MWPISHYTPDKTKGNNHRLRKVLDRKKLFRQEAITNPIEISNKKKRLKKIADLEMKDEAFFEIEVDQVGVKSLEEE